jgi:hypothetical protein
VRVVDGRCVIDDAVFAEGVLIVPQIG